jgi:hypothetical protein
MIASTHGGVFPHVRTRLERHVHRASAGALTRARECLDLGVRATKCAMSTLSHHFILPHEHCANERVRGNLAPACVRKRQRACHPLLAIGGGGFRRL